MTYSPSENKNQAGSGPLGRGFKAGTRFPMLSLRVRDVGDMMRLLGCEKREKDGRKGKTSWAKSHRQSSPAVPDVQH